MTRARGGSAAVLVVLLCACGPGLSSHPGASVLMDNGDGDITTDDGGGDSPGDSDLDSGLYRGVAYVSWYQTGPVYDRDESDTVITTQLVPIGANAMYVTQNMGVNTDGTLTSVADTETTAGLSRALTVAHDNGLTTGIVLVLDVDRKHYVPAAADVDTFFNSYTSALVSLATLAEAQGCSIFSIGFELGTLSAGYAAQWASVISAVRGSFSGTITYNFFNREADSATFVDALDVIGVDALFPLACQSPIDYLAGLSSTHGKQIVLTAVGFRSEQGAANQPEAVSGGPTDNSVQDNAWQGTLQVLLGTQHSWYGGIFVWEMQPYVTPEAQTATVGPNDYTPQNKAAYATIHDFFTH